MKILLCTSKRLKFEERRCTKISFTLMCKHKIWPFFQRPCSPWSPLALTKTPKKPDAMVQYEPWIIFGSKSILYFASRFGDSGKVLSLFAAECFFFLNKDTGHFQFQFVGFRPAMFWKLSTGNNLWTNSSLLLLSCAFAFVPLEKWGKKSFSSSSVATTTS